MNIKSLGGATLDSIMEWTGQQSLKVFYDYVKKGTHGREQIGNLLKLL